MRVFLIRGSTTELDTEGLRMIFNYDVWDRRFLLGLQNFRLASTSSSSPSCTSLFTPM